MIGGGERMRYFAAIAVFALLCAPVFANFTYLYSLNGTNSDEVFNDYLMSNPSGLLYANGRLYVADNGKNALYVMNGSRRERMVNPTMLSDGSLSDPMRMAYYDGKVFVADGLSGKLKTYNSNTRQIEAWNTASNVKQASGVAMHGEYAYVTDMGDGRISAYSLKHKSYSSIMVESGGADGLLLQPADIEYYQGNYYVTDKAKGLVNVYDGNFTFLYAFGRGRGGITLSGPQGVEVHRDRVFVADANAHRVVEFTLDGYPVQVLDSSVNGTDFAYPRDIALDGDTLYVADTEHGKVKVFAINESTGNDSIVQLLSRANQSLASLLSVQTVAQKIGVQFNLTNGAGDLAAAQVDYREFAFSSAASLAQKVIDTSDSQKAELSQKIELKLKQMEKAEQDKVAPYRQAKQPNLVADLARIDNVIADIEAKIASKSYGLAADAALGLPSIADKFVADAKKAAMSEEEKARAGAASGMKVEIEALSAKISRLKETAARYRQETNFTNTEAMALEAKGYLEKEDYGAANRSLELALTEISSYETALAAAASEIDAALSNITMMEFAFNASAAKPSLLPADISKEREAFVQAYNTAYSNSQLAVAMARQAAESGEVKLKDAQTLSVAAAALLLLFGTAGLIGVMFFLHLRHRKRGLHQPGHEKDGGEGAGEPPHHGEEGKQTAREQKFGKKGRQMQ